MNWFRKRPLAEPAARTAEDIAADDMQRLEAQDNVPRDPRDWPSDKAKYLTFGNAGDNPYGEGATAKLGPAEVTHHEDGSVSVGGKLVDNPEDYKGKPITGGIIEQLMQQTARNRRLREEQERATVAGAAKRT
ncbi:MAG: hypothetical protein E6G10_19160 [Actinobacteria bacterium]|nr:MAG: hypothetical protein E6G10_19160 [Actinomycetota bacterium]